MFKDDATVDTPPRSRRWRFWVLAIGLPLGALVLAAVGYVIRANGGLARAVADADRLDPGWRMEEIQARRETPPPGQNAADKVMAVMRYKTAEGWLSSLAFDAWGSDIVPERQLNDEQIAALNKVLPPIAPALTEARSLIDTSRGRHPITYSPDWISTLLPTIQTTREAVILLKYDVLAKAQAGDADGAVKSCHAALNAGTSIGDEPNLISQLVRIACQAVAANMIERALAQGEPSEAVLAALQARLEEVEAEPLLVYGLRGERAGGHQLFENISDGTVPTGNAVGAVGLGGGVPAPVVALIHVPGFLATQHAGHLAFLTEMIEIAKRPPEEWAAAFGDMRAKVNDLPLLAKLLAPAVEKMAEACRRNHVILRCAIVAVAAERYRRVKGQWPAKPEDLVAAGLLRVVPTDPHVAGQTIKFAKAADGLIVYSVGQDGTDDGGKLDRNPMKTGTDYGVRLWDVSARRQPPLPPKPATTDTDPNGPPGGPGTPAP